MLELREKTRKNKRGSTVALVVLLVVQAGLLIGGACSNSPTLNEPAHLAAGLHHWETADFSLYRVNPPLVRLMAAVPAKIIGYESDWSSYFDGVGARPEFEIGKCFIAANGDRSWTLFWLGRTAVIPLTLLATVVCFLWSRDLSQSGFGGLVAAALWAFDPFTLGHECLPRTKSDWHGHADDTNSPLTFQLQ